MAGWYETSPEQFDALRRELRAHYPSLHARVKDGKVLVAGTLALADRGIEIDRYSLEIALPDDYPRSPPTVWETLERIPRIIDRHVYPGNKSLCVGYPVELWIMLGGNFSIGPFIERAVRPYLIGNSLVEEGKPWPFGESSHGHLGALEFYRRYLGSDDPAVVGRFLLDLVDGRVRGHWDCPCGSGKALRKCHGEEVRALREVPRGIVLAAIKAMLDIMQSRTAAA